MSIPVALLQPYVAEFVAPTLTNDDRLPGLTTLAEKTCLSYDTVQRLWSGAVDSVSFEVADRILCAINAVQAWHRPGPLSEIYATRDLLEVNAGGFQTGPPSDRCQRHGCSNKLPPVTHRGGQPRKYCSTKCRVSAANKRNRPEPQGRYSNHNDVCPSGHDWSPENIYITPAGHRQCRVCTRERIRARRREAQQRAAS